MRRLSVFVLIFAAGVVGACTDSGQELAPTQPPTSEAETTTTPPPTTSTTDVPDTTTTTQPTTTTSTTLPELQSLAYEEVASIDSPIQLVAFNGDLDMLATKDGQVYLLEEQQRLREDPVLDISGQVTNSGERGLLSIAVDPDNTNRVFVHYSDDNGDTVVSEFTWDNESLIHERVWLQVDQPAGNHNGGMLQFGPDGALYLGLGDGGGSNDTYGNGQNTDTLLGGLVRIDVNDPDGGAELFQYGLRNPWRFWIDHVDDDRIYVADVGQNAYEEISVVPFEPGVNHGWPITEGLHCFRPSSGCDTSGLTLPVVEVSHGDAGTCSITGGMVYRGIAIPEIAGHFFYSDYCGGYLRSFRYGDGEALEKTDWTGQVGATPSRVLSFGVDGDGEMYVLTTNGVIKIVAVR